MCTFTAASEWATMSCTSRAMRRRSSSTRRCAACSRSASARSVRAAYSSSSSRRPRTTSPSSNGTAGQAISSIGEPTGLPATMARPPDQAAATTPTITLRRRLPCTATV